MTPNCSNEAMSLVHWPRIFYDKDCNSSIIFVMSCVCALMGILTIPLSLHFLFV